MQRKFFNFGCQAASVICCRVSPKQKSDVVGLAKKYGKWITLSIGDGANDVPMIMEAHIGVGIRGKEGSQAVRSADYAIGQFRFLQMLLLVHGRWGYRRVGMFICYYFYKNVILVFCEMWFAFYNGYSG
jgi:P-type E1-E2 ATPase